MSGESLRVRLDEVEAAWPVPVQMVTTVATLALLAALAKALVVLATKLEPAFLLRQPRRRRVYAVVCDNPGISFNELARTVGLARGTVQRHVDLLVGAGVLAVQGDRNRTHLFENHDRYGAVWREQAGLRDPDLRLLHAWLLACPSAVPQVDVLGHAEREWSWSRAAAYRRLRRLERHGLAVSSRSEGRKRYRALVPPPPAPPSPQDQDPASQESMGGSSAGS